MAANGVKREENKEFLKFSTKILNSAKKSKAQPLNQQRRLLTRTSQDLGQVTSQDLGLEILKTWDK
jgi:hypothetical protein